MLQPLTPAQGLTVGVGFVPGGDSAEAAASAAAMAHARLDGARPHLALVVTAGPVAGCLAETIRAELGPVGVAGGATSALLTDGGPSEEGALVVAIANAESAASGAITACGPDLGAAGQAAARLILAGWPFRARYPRGLGFAFARAGSGEPAREFLASWRDFMGPKMRTVCAVLPSSVLYGVPSAAPMVSVACLEAAYSTGLGYADGFAAEGPPPDREVLVHGSADAMSTALKRLAGDPARLVLVIESTERHRSLGDAAHDEWAAMRNVLGPQTPCVGWLCDRVAGYGRGVRPVDGRGALLIVALGDLPR